MLLWELETLDQGRLQSFLVGLEEAPIGEMISEHGELILAHELAAAVVEELDLDLDPLEGDGKESVIDGLEGDGRGGAPEARCRKVALKVLGDEANSNAPPLGIDPAEDPIVRSSVGVAVDEEIVSLGVAVEEILRLVVAIAGGVLSVDSLDFSDDRPVALPEEHGVSDLEAHAESVSAHGNGEPVLTASAGTLTREWRCDVLELFPNGGYVQRIGKIPPGDRWLCEDATSVHRM